jgi:hypothetical protein
VVPRTFRRTHRGLTTAPGSGPAGAGAALAAARGPGEAGRPGTVYGGPGTDGPGFATVHLPAGNPLENSGSLTGHILAQGWTDTPSAQRSSTARVVIVLAASLGLLVAISVLVVLMANDALGGFLGSAGSN